MASSRGCKSARAVLRAPTNESLSHAIHTVSCDDRHAGTDKTVLSSATLDDARGELTCARTLAAHGYTPSTRVEPNITDQHDEAFELWTKQLS